VRSLVRESVDILGDCFVMRLGAIAILMLLVMVGCDHLVYKLYQLTDDEVKIIDPEFELTEQEYTAITIE
jgi:hypothetical protein